MLGPGSPHKLPKVMLCMLTAALCIKNTPHIKPGALRSNSVDHSSAPWFLCLAATTSNINVHVSSIIEHEVHLIMEAYGLFFAAGSRYGGNGQP